MAANCELKHELSIMRHPWIRPRLIRKRDESRGANAVEQGSGGVIGEELKKTNRPKQAPLGKRKNQ